MHLPEQGHHVKEEQDAMFVKAKKAKVDLKALGERIQQRTQELKAEMGIDDEESADVDIDVPKRVKSNGAGRPAQR